MTSQAESNPRHANAQQLLQEYAAALWERIPTNASSVEPMRAAAALHRGQAPSEPVAAVAPAAPVPADASRPRASAGAPKRERPAHEELGLGALGRSWPAGREDAIDRLADLVAAFDSILGPLRPADAIERRAVEQLLDRRDEAVELISVRLYLCCRAIGVPVDVVEQGAQELAGWLGRRLYGSERLVFAPRRGRFIEGEQQLEVRESGPTVEELVVRGVSFGVRREDGSIVRRACVEREPRSGGEP